MKLSNDQIEELKYSREAARILFRDIEEMGQYLLEELKVKDDSPQAELIWDYFYGNINLKQLKSMLNKYKE